MLISLLVMPDYLLITSQSEEEVSCPVSIPFTPLCAIMVPLSQQQLSAQLCCSCRISSGSKAPPVAGKVETAALHLLRLQSLTSPV